MNSVLTLDAIGCGKAERRAASRQSGLDVLDELRRIVESPNFDVSDRNRRFLTYVVEEALAGREERIKAYTIATVVFGRRQNFDPGLDPIVRMEARRLRIALERFYLLDNAKHSCRITMPKGSYVPEFHQYLEAPSSHYHPYKSATGVSILVTAFDLEDVSGAANQKFGEGFSRQVAVRLNRSADITVFIAGPPTSPVTHATSNIPPFDTVLSGNIVAFSHGWRMDITLHASRDGLVIWADEYEGRLTGEDGLRERAEIADRIVEALSDNLLHGRMGSWMSASLPK